MEADVTRPLLPSPLNNALETSPLGCSSRAALSSSSPSFRADAASRRASGSSVKRARPNGMAQDRREWHERFLERCAQRIKADRSAAVAKRRGYGLAAYEQNDEPWSQEEEAILRRMALGEMRKVRWAMARQGSEEGYDDADDAVRSWESMHEQDVPDDLIEEEPPDESPLIQHLSPVIEHLLQSPCPCCAAAKAIQAHAEGAHCSSCGWRLDHAAILAGDVWISGHGEGHAPLILFDPAIGALCLCAGCPEQFALA